MALNFLLYTLEGLYSSFLNLLFKVFEKVMPSYLLTHNPVTRKNWRISFHALLSRRPRQIEYWYFGQATSIIVSTRVTLQ